MRTLRQAVPLSSAAPGRFFASGVVRLGLVSACALVVPLGPQTLAAQDGRGLPRVEDILKKTIERAQWAEDQNFGGRYIYTRRSIIDQFDSKETLKKHEERLHQVVPIDGESYPRLVQKDGRPLTEKEIKQEQEREQKFRQRVEEKRRNREQGKKHEEAIELDDELVGRYRFDSLGRELINGRPAYVLRFEPRSEDLPVRRRIDRLLNKLAGKLWIDEQDFQLSRVDLHLAENVSAWGGMLASVRKFVLRVEQTRVDEAAWFPHTVDAYIDGRILVKSVHLQLKQENSNFRRIAPAAASVGSSRQ